MTILTFLFARLYKQDSLTINENKKDTFPVKILDEVIVSVSRIQEKLLHSLVSVEKLNTNHFAGSATLSFFDALQNIKGAHMITTSLCFRVINTSGFSNTTNVGFAQLTDGMDILSTQIGTSVGNTLGPTDLDIKNVEIVPGSTVNATIDAQVGYSFPKLLIRIKAGASNLLNQYYVSFLGGHKQAGFIIPPSHMDYRKQFKN